MPYDNCPEFVASGSCASHRKWMRDIVSRWANDVKNAASLSEVRGVLLSKLAMVHLYEDCPLKKEEEKCDE